MLLKFRTRVVQGDKRAVRCGSPSIKPHQSSLPHQTSLPSCKPPTNYSFLLSLSCSPAFLPAGAMQRCQYGLSPARLQRSTKESRPISDEDSSRGDGGSVISGKQGNIAFLYWRAVCFGRLVVCSFGFR